MAESYGSEQSLNSQNTSPDVMKQDNTRVYNEEVAGSGFDERSPSDSDSPSDTPPSRSRDEASASSASSSRPSSLHSGLSSRSATQSDIESTGVDNIRVVVRVRPLNPSEKEKVNKNIIKLPGDGAIWIDNSYGQIKPFTFNAVLGEVTSQAEMFDDCGIKHLINMALEGYSCTAFAFGRTGSGKTFTITGPLDGQYQEGALPTPQMQGLIERSFQYMFHEMEKKSEKVNYTLRASYLEVYNEKVKDLLNPSSAHDSLPVRWSRDRGFYVENLFYVECDSMDDLMAVLEEGLRYRQVGSHMMNDHSSRSHSMLTVYIDIELSDPDDDAGFSTFRHGKLSFVDLAGSERVKETKSAGEAFTESQNINKSLLTLGNCISALSDNRKRGGHIPYRDSKLTKLLADSLGGDGITLMIACISPSSSVVSDTLNTLRYANRAKKIKNKPVVQMDPKEKLILSLKREIKLLRTENNYFRQQLGLPSSDSQTTVTTISPKDATDQNDNNLHRKHGSPDQRQPAKSNSLFVREDERNKLTTASLTAGANSGLYDMLQEYMMENECLRTENSDLHKSREEVSRQQMVVSRENERLLKKLEDLERVFVSSPISLQSLSAVERSRSMPENKANLLNVARQLAEQNSKSNSNPDILNISDKPLPAAAAIFARRHSIPDPSCVRMRSTSEPRELPVRFPPLSNGPYPNYINETWSRDSRGDGDGSVGPYSPHARSLPEESRQHPNRKPFSKSSPAKLRKKPPSFPTKPAGGYASIFTKHKDKEKRAKQLKRKETTPTSNEPRSPAHAQTYAHPGLTAPGPSYSYQSSGYASHVTQPGVPGMNSYASHVTQPGVPGMNSYASHVTQPRVPDMNAQAYYAQGPLQGQPNYRMNQELARDLGNLDSQIDYYQHVTQNQHQQSPHR